jgi:hypothetical protein
MLPHISALVAAENRGEPQQCVGIVLKAKRENFRKVGDPEAVGSSMNIYLLS